MEMAGAARGAVSSLLGSLSSVLVDEVKQLWGVRRELQSIKDEMESMNSFLLDLEEVHRPSHQQKTWMRQVRDLAYSAEHCISLQQALILREGHRSKGLLGYLPPPVQTLHARHKLAMEVRELNERIKKVNERRQRYGVQVPRKSGDELTTTTTLAPITGVASSSQTAGGGDEGIIPGDDEQTPKDEAMRALAFAEPRILEECTQELVNWLSYTEERARWLNEGRLPSIAIAAPDREHGADVAREALAHPSVATKFEHTFWITFPFFLPAKPVYILEEILGELLPKPPEGEWAKTEELDRKIEEIVKFSISIEHRHWTPLYTLYSIMQELLQGPVRLVGEDQIEDYINETAMHIKEYLEELDKTRSWIGLDHSYYVDILRELLIPQPKEDMDQRIEFITKKIKRTLENIKQHLLVEEIAKKIKDKIEGKRTVIVLDCMDYVERWEMIKWALSKLGCAAGSAVIVTKNYTQGAYQYCNPTQEPIKYSLVGFYHHKARLLTSPFVNEEYYCNANILHAILKYCEPHELCMKLFVRALYANPNRSNEELDKFLDTLVFSGPLDINAKKMLMFSYGDLPREYKTCFLYLAIFPRGHKIRRSTLVGQWIAEGLIAKENWLRSVHRAEQCFDALVDRWLVYPGDIGAVGKVKSCTVDDLVIDFIIRIARKENFVDTGLSHHSAQHSIYNALHRSESNMVPPKSHPTNYCLKECIRELCTFCIKKKGKNRSQPIGLLNGSAESATSLELQMLKVLDFEGYQCLGRQHMKHIHKKTFLLRYLSLRNTNVKELPKRIGKLQLLEILDIRQTGVDASFTKHIVLPKLKRLLAGHIDQSASNTDTEEAFSTVLIPHRIEKMTNLEVVSHVEASQSGAELKDIGKLRKLRKLGVVINEDEDHIKKLLEVISNLHECLKSLSIRIKPLQPSPSNTDINLANPPELLESLSIRGTATSRKLFPLLAKSRDELAKVTLRNTLLNQDNMKDLGDLPKLRCVRLQHESYIESKLTFKKEEFQNLKYLLVEGSNMTDISFEDGAATELEKIVLCSINITSITFGNGAAPKLEEISLSSTNITNITFQNGATPNLKKIVLSYTNMEFLSGINLLGLKELELNGSWITSAFLLSLFTNANQIAKVTLCGTLLKQGDMQIIAKQPNMRCLMLLEKSCDESQLTFNEDEFPKLKLLVVECFRITKISFVKGAAPNLEKIVWSFTNLESLSGIGNLLELKELEFKGDKIPNRMREAIAEHPNYPVLKHTQQKNQDKEEEAQQQRILDSN